MKIKDKELLLQDLCSRLPYHVKCEINGKIEILNSICDDDGYYFNFIGEDKEGYTLDEVKPYLFPMSAITEEQKRELITLAEYEDKYEEYCGFDSNGHCIDIVEEYEYKDNKECVILFPNYIGIDFCNKHHLDYRGLIPKGLAIDCTNLNIY